MKRATFILFLFWCFFAKAQTFTFQCVDSTQLTGINCDVCPSTNNLSRSFCGLLIFRNGTPYRWIDQPYTIRLRPGNSIEYIEQIPSIAGVQTQDRITISRSQTGFSTSVGMIDSTFCHCSGIEPLFYASDSLNLAPIYGGDTLLLVGRDLAHVTFDSLLQKYVVQVDSVSNPTANNGVSDNEAGGVFRLGNRYMGTPDAPFTMARKINVDGRLLHIGDLSDSTLFVVDGATDRIGIRTDAPAKDLHVNGEARISDLINGTPDRVIGANSSGDLSRHYLSGMSVIGGVLTATDSSTTNEIQQIDTFTIVSNILRLSLSSDGQPFKSVDLSPYVPTGTVTSVATTAPAAGFTISGGPITTSGTFLFTLANDLAALEAISTTGIAVRTASEAWTTRSIAASTGISVANGDGVSGNPTITNTAPDQVVSITGAGINVVTGTYPTFTVTGTELDGSVTNEIQVANSGLSDNEAAIIRLGNRYMNGSDGLFATNRSVNVNANKLFFGDNTDSTLLHIDGTNDRVGIKTNAPGRAFVVNGEVEIKDLVTTTPDRIVGTDGNGVLSEITVSTGLSLSGGLLTSTGGTFYQTFRDDGTGMAQQPVANFVASGRISTTLTNDVGNTETEVLMDIIANSIGNTHIRQGVARSVIGVTGNATANVADIQGTADQVLRVTTAGTALSFGTVATGGISDDAVTYAKLQNVAANNVLLGNDNGAGVNAQELTVAEVYTLLGMTGVDTRIAVWKGANTLGNDAGLVFDYTNDRQTITCTTPTFGAGTAILNVTNVGTDGTAEFIQSRGNIDGNLICNQTNLSSTASSNSFYQIQQQGDASGDAFLQFATLGAGGITHSIGLDNTDNRFKLTPNATTPGGNVNMGVILRDNAGIGNTGINKDFPGHPLDGLGRAAFELWQGGAGNQWTFAGNVTYGNGAGTGPTGATIVGHGNSVRLSFTTGTTPTLDGDVVTLTYPFTFTTTSIVVFSARNSDATQPDFYISAESNTACTLKVRGTLTASTTYNVNFHLWGY